jgi:hypothetical protein
MRPRAAKRLAKRSNRRPNTAVIPSPKPTSPASDAAPRPAPASKSERWVTAMGWVALAVFIALPMCTYVFEAYAGGVVWTIMITSLPVFIVLVGYHRWRRICPLAFLAQLPARLQHPGTRKAGPWLEAHYYYVASKIQIRTLPDIA